MTDFKVCYHFNLYENLSYFLFYNSVMIIASFYLPEQHNKKTYLFI